MLNNRTINSNTENSFLSTYFNLEEQLVSDLTSKKSRHLYENIENAVINFDRHFDNTVVDTYAFDKVLHSAEVKNTIYYYLNDSDLNMINRLTICKEAVSAYIIHEVTEIYQHNNHTVFNSDVYDDYIDKLFERILIQK